MMIRYEKARHIGQPDGTSQRHFRYAARSALAVAVCAALFGGADAQAVTTEFSVTGQTGSFVIGSTHLNNLSQLTGSGQTYNYIGQFFTPTTSSSYTFGTSSATFDTVLIFYSGSYDSGNPGANAIALNDDSGGAQSTYGLAHAANCSTLSYCSEITGNLTAGTNYYVVTTTYSAGTAVGGTVWFYVIGDAAVGVGGVPALSVLGSAETMGNQPAYGAAQAIDGNVGLLSLFAASGLTTDQQISSAATQTLPLLTGGSMVATRDVLSSINRVIQARVEQNLGMSAGDAFFGDKHVWMKPFGSWTDQDNRSGVAGYKADTYGLAFGVDGALSNQLRLGGAFAYASSNIDGKAALSAQSADVDVYQLIAYGSYSLDDRMDINFQAGYGQNTNKGQRKIAFTSSTASSSYSSQTAQLGVGVERSYRLSDQTTVVPSVRADYTWIKDDGYRETGAGLLDLKVNGRSTEALVLGVDGKLVHALDGRTKMTGNLGIGYDTLNKRAAITAAFAGAPGAAFVTYGIDPSPWLVRGGIGAVHNTVDGMQLTARYDAEYRESFLNQTVSVKLRWAF